MFFPYLFVFFQNYVVFRPQMIFAYKGFQL